MQSWGRLSIRNQHAALERMRAAGSPAAQSSLLNESTLLIENVGPTMAEQSFSAASFMRAWWRDSKALGTLVNDLRPRNYGAGFRAFDPALDVVDKSLLYGGAGASVTGAVMCVGGVLICQH
jgi:hypothetical protein